MYRLKLYYASLGACIGKLRVNFFVFCACFACFFFKDSRLLPTGRANQLLSSFVFNLAPQWVAAGASYCKGALGRTQMFNSHTLYAMSWFRRLYSKFGGAFFLLIFSKVFASVGC